MYNTTTSSILKMLTGEGNPDKSAVLPGAMSLHSKTYQTYLIQLVYELALLATHESHWTEEELEQLKLEWAYEKRNLEIIALNHRRTEQAVALKLISSGIDNEYTVITHLAILGLRLAHKCSMLNLASFQSSNSVAKLDKNPSVKFSDR